MSQQQKPEQEPGEPNEREAKTRRDFLKSLGKWSAIVIGSAALGGLMSPDETAGGVNGGGSWVNGRGGWVNAHGGWINKAGGGGTAWVNGGGGGAGWVNRRGSWINRN